MHGKRSNIIKYLRMCEWRVVHDVKVLDLEWLVVWIFIQVLLKLLHTVVDCVLSQEICPTYLCVLPLYPRFPPSICVLLSYAKIFSLSDQLIRLIHEFSLLVLHGIIRKKKCCKFPVVVNWVVCLLLPPRFATFELLSCVCYFVLLLFGCAC